MNKIVARMLGEADYHSQEEKAVLNQAGEVGHEEASGNAEESKEVQLANQIITAVKAGQKEQVVKLARQLIKLHRPQTGREGIEGEIGPQDFLSGAPFNLKRHGDPRNPYFRIKNVRPLPKRLTAACHCRQT